MNKNLINEIKEIENSLIMAKNELSNLRKNESVTIETLIEKNTEIKNLEKSIIEKKESVTRFFNKVKILRKIAKKHNFSLQDFIECRENFSSKLKKFGTKKAITEKKSNIEKLALLKNKDAIKKGIDAKFFELLKSGYDSYLDDDGNDKIKVKVISIEKIGLKDATKKTMYKINAKLSDGKELKSCYMYKKNFDIFKSGMEFDFDYYAYFR
jgi:hypothetical protein